MKLNGLGINGWRWMARTGKPSPLPEVLAELESKQQDCGRCGHSRGTLFRVEHIVPRMKGGTDDLSNLRLICAECHVERPRTKMLNLRVDWGDWDRMRKLSERYSVSVSDLVRGMINKSLEGDIVGMDTSGKMYLIEIKAVAEREAEIESED